MTRSLITITANTAQSQSEPPEVICLSAFGGLWSRELDTIVEVVKLVRRGRKRWGDVKGDGW